MSLTQKIILSECHQAVVINAVSQSHTVGHCPQETVARLASNSHVGGRASERSSASLWSVGVQVQFPLHEANSHCLSFTVGSSCCKRFRNNVSNKQPDFSCFFCRQAAALPLPLQEPGCSAMSTCPHGMGDRQVHASLLFQLCWTSVTGSHPTLGDSRKSSHLLRGHMPTKISGGIVVTQKKQGNWPVLSLCYCLPFIPCQAILSYCLWPRARLSGDEWLSSAGASAASQPHSKPGYGLQHPEEARAG